MNDSAPIDAALAAWQAEQRLRGGYTSSELDELSDHVRSSAAALAPTAAERVQLAAQRIGASAELAREYERVRGMRLDALAFSPAGLLTSGALLWVFAEWLVRGTKLGITAALLWFFPDATHEAVLIGTLVSLGVVAYLATLLSSEHRARAIGEQLRMRPWRLAAVCALIAILTLMANGVGMTFLFRIADTATVANASGTYISILPFAGYLSWTVVPLILFATARRAARRSAPSPAIEQVA